MKFRLGFVANSSSYSCVICLGIISKDFIGTAIDKIDTFNSLLSEESKIFIVKLTDIKPKEVWENNLKYHDGDPGVYIDENLGEIIVEGLNGSVSIPLSEIKNFENDYIALMNTYPKHALSFFEGFFKKSVIFDKSEVYIHSTEDY